MPFDFHGFLQFDYEYIIFSKTIHYWLSFGQSGQFLSFSFQGNKAAKLFKEIDTDGSGYITAAEFKRVLLKQIDRVVDEIHKMDKNGDGKISLKGKGTLARLYFLKFWRLNSG